MQVCVRQEGVFEHGERERVVGDGGVVRGATEDGAVRRENRGVRPPVPKSTSRFQDESRTKLTN